ncbi:hypothetical protein RhiTH_000567 [Rhizoctonia solani]
MTDKPKSKRLTFKGEKKSKKRKAREVDEDQREEDIDPGTWVQPETPEQILGPTFIIHDNGTPTCVAFDSTRNRINIQTLSSASSSSGETSKPLSIVPSDVHQVWVATRVAGSLTINLRTPEGKFLSCDALGLVSADREARGPQEEFTPVILPETDEQGNHMVAFKNIYEKYISVDEVAGGQTTLRGDSETVGFNERFWIRVQHEYKHKAGEEDRKKTGKTRPQEIDEVGSNHKFQAWGAGRSVVSVDDSKALKKARKEGALSEALLDRRIKLKRYVFSVGMDVTPRLSLGYPLVTDFVSLSPARLPRLRASAVFFNAICEQKMYPQFWAIPVVNCILFNHFREQFTAQQHTQRPFYAKMWRYDTNQERSCDMDTKQSFGLWPRSPALAPNNLESSI